jgi:heat shock protein HspQ
MPGTVIRAKFSVGDVIQHNRFGYRGVVFDVDPTFQNSDEWYENVARSKPPRDRPWYHVLPQGGTHTTYVAERHLDADASGSAIEHPGLDELFCGFQNGAYIPRKTVN